MELEAGKRRCKYCNRWFPNGKSLGGHMKSHLSLTYSKATPGAGTSSSQPQSQKKRKAPLSTTTEDEYNCKKCGKSFPCWRSYLGHVNWHKSVQNDPNIKINSDGEASEDAEINRAAHLLIALSRMECSCKNFPGVNPHEEGTVTEAMKEKYKCPVCPEIFSTEKGLGCHMKLVHMPPVPKGAGKSKVVEEKPELGFDLNVALEDSGHPSDEV